MSERSMEQLRELLDSIYRVDSGRILAALIRLLGDFDLAEEAMHEAFAAALSLWPRSGGPGNPPPWVISRSGRILAALIRFLGDFDLAEEAMHEAFAAALSLWPRSGVPGNPRPWLISTARFKAIDTLRRRARFDASQDELVRYLEAQWSSAEGSNEEDSLEDGF